MAALEGGVGALALASGAAAVRYSLRNITTSGSSVVAAPQLYGATYTLFAHLLPEEGVDVRFAVDDQPQSLDALIDDTTAAVFCESIGNPAGNVVDLPAVCEMAHARGVPVIVDNTVATPMLLKPLQHGADIVIHSLTKFVGGHGTTLGGLIVDGGRFPWSQHADRFPMFCAGAVVSRSGVRQGLPRKRLHRPLSHRRPAKRRGHPLPVQRLSPPAGSRDSGTPPRTATSQRRGGRPMVESRRSRGLGQLVGLCGSSPSRPGLRLCGGRYPSILTFGVVGRYEAGIRFFNDVKLFLRW